MTIHKRENKKISHANFNGECSIAGPSMMNSALSSSHTNFPISIIHCCVLCSPGPMIYLIHFFVDSHSYFSFTSPYQSLQTKCECVRATDAWECVWNANYIYRERERTKAERKRWREEWQMIRIHIFVFDEKWDHKTRQEGTRNASRMKNRGRSWKY